jgi:hypothetical protein
VREGSMPASFAFTLGFLPMVLSRSNRRSLAVSGRASSALTKEVQPVAPRSFLASRSSLFETTDQPPQK